jgi:hypothetical protein
MRFGRRARVVVASGLVMLTLVSLAWASPAWAAGPGLVTLKFKATHGLVHWNSKVGLSGSLAFADLSTTAGEQVTISMALPGGSPHVLQHVTLTATGEFSLSSPRMKKAGTYTFTADYAGNLNEEAASKSVDVHLTVITLKRSHKTVTFGQSVTITGHLEIYRRTAKHKIAIYRAVYPHATYRLVSTGKTDRRGNYSLNLEPGRLSVFIALWVASTPDPVFSNAEVVKVRAKITVALPADSGVSGGVHVLLVKGLCRPYPYSPTTFVFVCGFALVTVAPNRHGSDMCFDEQKHVASGWKTVFNWCKKLSRKSRFRVPLTDKSSRVKFDFPSDGPMTGNTSGWIYYRWVAVPLPPPAPRR